MARNPGDVQETIQDDWSPGRWWAMLACSVEVGGERRPCH